MKKILFSIAFTLGGSLACLAQSAPAQSGYDNRDGAQGPDTMDTKHPKGNDPKADGTRVLKADSAENATKPTRAEANKQKTNKSAGTTGGAAPSKRSSASKTKE